MEVISIINRKGGAGKTTTAQALGARLAAKGSKVLYIDLDNQGNLTYAVGANKTIPTIYEVLTKSASINDAIIKLDQADILPASDRLINAELELNGIGREFKLKEALALLNEQYDYIVIDTPASLGVLTINALAVSNKVIIPVQADMFSLQGVMQINETIEAVRKYVNPNVVIDGLLFTRYNSRSVLTRDLTESIEELAGEIGTKVYQSRIREGVAIKEAQTMQQDIYTYAPKSNGAHDYALFVDEFERG